MNCLLSYNFNIIFMLIIKYYVKNIRWQNLRKISVWQSIVGKACAYAYADLRNQIDRLMDGWKEQTFQDLQSLHQVCSVFSLIEYKRRKWSHHTPPPLIILGFTLNGLVIWVSQIIRVGLFGSEQSQTGPQKSQFSSFKWGLFGSEQS